MKETLDEESRKALIDYRMERAHETMKEAKVMLREGFYNASINRLYYACFYAVLALLLQNKIATKTHAGAKTMLGMHFIANGKLPLECGKTFNTLFEKRHSGDYDDFVICDKDMVDSLMPKAEDFIDTIEKLLNKK